MSDSRWQRQWEIFHAALERPAAERTAFVAAETEGDAGLEAEILKLLAAHDESGDLLAEPLLIGQGTLDALEPEALLDKPIGNYTPTAVLGEGGMGVVYLAEQTEPVRRKVALKVIRLGMNTREVVRRFELERQALAMMTHPNIARVFDAGVTDDGRPYFVMEYVEGTPLTKYCDERRLSIRRRLELFCEVCEAIQHAHQKGVIHRDIKPSNVLVEIGDQRRATPKVIDFGIAKAIDQRITEKTVATKLGRIVGTPAYMSPEQADFNGDRVDTRSDIYSLSVLLYELLTSTTPFEKEQLLSAGYAEINRIIREEDPQPPSTRLSHMALDTARNVAQSRSASAGDVQQQVRGDLDWIILKGLEKSPDRRYSSAAELEADIRRHINDEPVEARPPTRRYRLAKFYRRNRLATNAAALILVLGIAFTVTTVFQSRDLARALDEATIERTRAEQVTAFILELLAEADPAVSGADSVSVREVLDRGAAELESRLDEQPATRAAAIFAIGNVYRELGLYDQASSILELAVPIEPAVEAESASLLGALYLQRAFIAHDLGNLAEAEQLYRRSEQLVSIDGSASDLVETWGGLGQVMTELGSAEEGRGYLEDALELALSADERDEASVNRLLNQLSAAYLALGEFERAAEASAFAIELSQDTFGDSSSQLAMAYTTDAVVSKRLGRFEDALAAEDEALRIYRSLMGEEHLYTATLLSNRGATLTTLGRLPEAEAAALEALGIYSILFEESHPNNIAAESNLANIYLRQGKYVEAEAAFRHVLSLDRESLGDNHPYVIADMESIASTLVFQERVDEALELQEQVIETRRRVLTPGHPSTARALSNYGKWLIEADRAEEARAAIEEALSMLTETEQQDPVLLATRFARAELMFLLDDVELAETEFEGVLAVQRDALGSNHPDVATSLFQLARVKAALDKFDESEEMLREAVSIRRAMLGEQHPLTVLAESELDVLLGGINGNDGP